MRIKKLFQELVRKKADPQQEIAFTKNDPDSFPAPRTDSPLEAARYLLTSKAYVANHNVPEEFKDFNNQYSHAGDAALTPDDISKPAITNCSYEHFGTCRFSLGFPMFIGQTTLKTIAHTGKEGFTAVSLGLAMNNVFKRYGIDSVDMDYLKSGYQRPTNHWYIEAPINQKDFQAAKEAIQFFASTDEKNPHKFLDKLDKHMTGLGHPPTTPKPRTSARTPGIA